MLLGSGVGALVSSLLTQTQVEDWGWAVAFVYAMNDLTERLHVSTARALNINTLAMFAILCITPFAGLLSDRIGRKPLAIFAAAGTALLGLPLWWMIHHQSPPSSSSARSASRSSSRWVGQSMR